MVINKSKLGYSLGLCFSIASCGDDAARTIDNTLSAAMGLIALSSPTATSSATFSNQSLDTYINFVPQADLSATDVKTAEDIVEDLTERLEATTTSACVANLNLTFKNRPNLNCFGPSYVVSASYGGTFTNTVTSGTYNGYGSHPGGDSGLVLAEEDGEACAAATMNRYGTYATQALMISQELMAAGLCLANNAGLSLPAASGEKIDMLSTATAGFGTTATITKFELTHGGDDGSGNPVYNLSVAGTVGGKAFSIESENAKSSTGSSGQVRGYYDTSANSTPDYFGFSVDYSGTDTARTIEYRSARNRNTASNDFFNATTGKLDFQKGSAIGEDLFFIKFKGSMDDETRDGAMLFAWQAGDGDSHARTFQADVQGTTATGYFSYGYKLNDSGTTDDELGKIEGMICDWALTPSANHATQAAAFANKAMKQVMTLTSGKFVNTTANISYAPHTSCDGHATYDMVLVSGLSPNLTALTVTGATKSFTASFTNDLQSITAGFGIEAARKP